MTLIGHLSLSHGFAQLWRHRSVKYPALCLYLWDVLMKSAGTTCGRGEANRQQRETEKGKRWIQRCSFHLFPPSHSSVLRFLLLFWRLSGFTRPCCMETSGNERISEMITHQMGSGVYRRKQSDWTNNIQTAVIDQTHSISEKVGKLSNLVTSPLGATPCLAVGVGCLCWSALTSLFNCRRSTFVSCVHIKRYSKSVVEHWDHLSQT